MRKDSSAERTTGYYPMDRIVSRSHPLVNNLVGGAGYSDIMSPQDSPGDAVPVKPDWWVENRKYRERFDLPEYDPPKFRDDVYTSR